MFLLLVMCREGIYEIGTRMLIFCGLLFVELEDAIESEDMKTLHTALYNARSLKHRKMKLTRPIMEAQALYNVS